MKYLLSIYYQSLPIHCNALSIDMQKSYPRIENKYEVNTYKKINQDKFQELTKNCSETSNNDSVEMSLNQPFVEPSDNIVVGRSLPVPGMDILIKS